MKIQLKPKTTVVGDTTARKTIKWKSANGNEIFIEEMTDDHLKNSIALLDRLLGNIMDPIRLQVMKMMKTAVMRTL